MDKLFDDLIDIQIESIKKNRKKSSYKREKIIGSFMYDVISRVEGDEKLIVYNHLMKEYDRQFRPDY